MYGGGRPCGTGLLGTEPSSDGVSMSSRSDASGAAPMAGWEGLREQGGLRGSRQSSVSLSQCPRVTSPLVGWLGHPRRALSLPSLPASVVSTCLLVPLLPMGQSSCCPRMLCPRPGQKAKRLVPIEAAFWQGRCVGAYTLRLHQRLPSPAKRFWDLLDQCLVITCGIWLEGHVLSISFLSKSDQELEIDSDEGHCLYL